MRYLPHTPETRKKMLEDMGISHVDALYKAVPEGCLLKDPLKGLPLHQGELEVERALSKLAALNRTASSGPFFMGAGCYRHHIPATVDAIVQRGEFLTAYTPYQPEVSQGTLQAIFEFQSMICALTGQGVANASMYDGATSLAEAALMARRITKKEHAFLATPLHPHYKETLETYLGNFDGEIQPQPDETTACIIVQTPDDRGNCHGLEAWRKQADELNCLLVVVITEILSLGLLPAPKQADIVCGEAQSIGVSMSYGGPHLGFFATQQAYVRQMPGRLCGATVDTHGRRSFVLTLNAREQHIRREKATSNICTNEGLMALAFTVHMALLGEGGFQKLARLNHAKACQLADMLGNVEGINILNDSYFNELTIQLPCLAQPVHEALVEQGFLPGVVSAEHTLLLAVTEMTTTEDMHHLTDALKAQFFEKSA